MNCKLGFVEVTLGAPRAQFRRLKSRNSPSWGDCSFSPDLTADVIPATGGHRRFVLRQGRDAPGPSLGEAACKNISNKRRLRRWGLRKFEASGPRKPGKSLGKSSLFPRDYSLAFPGCFASGLAAKGGRARSTRPSSFAILSNATAGTKSSQRIEQFPQERVQGIIPCRGVWGRGCPSGFLFPSNPNFSFMREPFQGDS